MSKYVVLQSVVKPTEDGGQYVTFEPITCEGGNSHVYEHTVKRGTRAGMPILNDRCICGAEYWGEEDDRIFLEAKAAGRVTVR